MQKNNIKHLKKALLLSIMVAVTFTSLFTSCEPKEEKEEKLELKSFGPMPIARGAELRFIGTKLNQVTSIILPDNIEITEFGTKTDNLITITVPQEAIEGKIILNTSEGEIITKTDIGFSEPISISEFSPASIKPGGELTIKGDYLNLINEVIFTDRIVVVDSMFVSKSRKELKLIVPAEAQTGKVAISNGWEDPIIIYTETELKVTLPVITKMEANPVKAGENLTITGTDLDLVKNIKIGFDADSILPNSVFVSQEATKIVIRVPEASKDGKLILMPASGVEVVSIPDLTMVLPTVSVTPIRLKNGEDITVSGTDLDLVSKILFGGDFEGTIKEGGSATEIMVTVPNEALTGEVKFMTMADKQVTGGTITIIDPTITSFTPDSAKPKSDVTIDGTDLDVVTGVVFEGDIEGTITAQSATQLTVTIPVGAKEGKIKLVTLNGTEILTSTDIVVSANLPEMTGYVEPGGIPGNILTLKGKNLLLIKEMKFPGDIIATSYGAKNDTMLQVYVPLDVEKGVSNITIYTYEGDEGITPEVYFGTTDPVQNPDLIINDFDETGHDLSWDNWSDYSELGSDPDIAISGNYLHAKVTTSAWGFIWGCNHAELVKRSVTKADHVLKMDINLTKPFNQDGIVYQFNFAGTRIDLGALGIEDQMTGTTPGWITITYDLSEYGDLPDVIPAEGEWGMNFGWANGEVDMTGLYIDNIRFETK